MEIETIIKSAVLGCLIMFAVNLNGQTKWVYTYDNVGNRIQRVINTGAKARKQATANSLLDDGKIRAVNDVNRNIIKVEILPFSSYDIAEVTIYNLSGIQMLSHSIDSETTVLNLGKLQKGTYILNIILNGETKSCKFSK